MALASTDLLKPNGEINGLLFYPTLSPSDVSALIASYLTQGYAAATAAGVTDAGELDLAARRWVYYLAWSDVVDRITLTPASTSLAGEVSTTMLQTQIDQWIAKRDYWLAQYGAVIPVPTQKPTGPVSVALPTRVCW